MRGRVLPSLLGFGVPFLFATLIAPRADAIIVQHCGGGEAVGRYHGFFQSSLDRGVWGLVEFVVTPDHNRRFQGVVTMINPATSAGLPFPVEGTLSASCHFSVVGRQLGAKVEVNGRIHFYDGGAAIADARYIFGTPPDPNAPEAAPDQGIALLLRSFMGNDTMPPNLNGMWEGDYVSDGDGGRGTLALDVTQMCRADGSSLSRSFTGEEIVDKGTDHQLELYFQGTIGSGPLNPILVVGWSLFGDRFVVTGNYHPPDPGNVAGIPTATFHYELTFFDGTVDKGTFTIGQPQIPPPCRGVIGQ